MQLKPRVILLILVLVILHGPVQAATAPVLMRSVIASGGGRGEQSGLVLIGTLGQPIIGRSPPGDDALCTGFWCSAGGASYPVYLPLVSKDL